MSKQRKEALAAIMDGLDILVGMDKPEEKNEVEKEKAPDSFTGLLQSLIPLMIIPQILPLFQQALGQTLRDTTVNVKVEAATSIIPIDITATTAIVPIEIRASQVTINVNITGSAVTLNVNVTNALININITGQTINVRIENPAGIPLYVAQPVRVSRATAAGSSGRPADIQIRSITGRTRLLGIVVDVSTADSWVNLWNNVINIIVDGVQNPLSFGEIARWNGGLPITFPPGAGSYIEARFLSELGGWTFAYETTVGTRWLRLTIQLQFDALSSLEIRLYVPAGGADVSYRIYSIVGFYP